MRPIKRAQWVGCWLAFHACLRLPLWPAISQPTLWGRFNTWLLGLGGAYGYSIDFEDFCKHVRFR